MQTCSSDDCIDTFYVCSLQSTIPKCQDAVKPLYSEKLAATKHVKRIYFSIMFLYLCIKLSALVTVYDEVISHIAQSSNALWALHKNM